MDCLSVELLSKIAEYAVSGDDSSTGWALARTDKTLSVVSHRILYRDVVIYSAKMLRGFDDLLKCDRKIGGWVRLFMLQITEAFDAVFLLYLDRISEVVLEDGQLVTFGYCVIPHLFLPHREGLGSFFYTPNIVPWLSSYVANANTLHLSFYQPDDGLVKVTSTLAFTVFRSLIREAKNLRKLVLTCWNVLDVLDLILPPTLQVFISRAKVSLHGPPPPSLRILVLSNAYLPTLAEFLIAAGPTLKKLSLSSLYRDIDQHQGEILSQILVACSNLEALNLGSISRFASVFFEVLPASLRILRVIFRGDASSRVNQGQLHAVRTYIQTRGDGLIVFDICHGLKASTVSDEFQGWLETVQIKDARFSHKPAVILFLKKWALGRLRGSFPYFDVDADSELMW
ncbi:hypothetical protein ACEPAG_268 [Sanghuangporus baumii]